MLELIPERFRTPQVARAMTSPSAILLTGIGAAAVIASNLPLVLAPIAGIAAYVARVGVALPRTKPDDEITPHSLREPWRTFTRDALQAKRRFDDTWKRTPHGPLKDRLGMLGQRIGDGVEECWQIARHADSLEEAQHAMRANEIESELQTVRHDIAQANNDGDREMLGRTEAALNAQLSSYMRIRSVADDARNRLRLLNAQLDEAVARAIELSVRRSDVSEVSSVSADVENLVTEMETLRQALQDTGATSSGQ